MASLWRKLMLSFILFNLSVIIFSLHSTGFLSLLIFAAAFAIGYFLSLSSISKWKDLPSVCPQLTATPRGVVQFNDQRSSPLSCLVCGDAQCRRHKPELSVDLHPWKGVFVDKRIDDAIEEILELTLKEHIHSWYRDIGSDGSRYFDIETRQMLRCVIASLMQRIRKVDFDKLILKKLPNILINHVEMFVHGKRRAKTAHFLEEAVLLEYGTFLHPALLGRDEEIKWLQGLVEFALPYLLAPKYLNSKLVFSFLREVLSCCILLPVADITADPDKVNAIIELLFDKESILISQRDEFEKVELLERFVLGKENNELKNKTDLGIELKKILSDEQLLFLFTQFAKEEGFAHLIEFLKQIDTFTPKTLNPELTREQLKELHQETGNIFNSYFSTNSRDYISFDSEIYFSLQDIVNGKVEDVEKLRTEAPLYRAYEHVYNLLENYYCQLFFQSDFYFKLLCGKRGSSYNSESPVKNQNSVENSETIDTRKDVYDSSTQDDLTIDENVLNSISDSLRDLSSWRVAISTVEKRLDFNGKESDVYIIKVQRLDIKQDEMFESNWEVERRYHEFYVLEAKLKEFHGDKLNDLFLPPKRSFLKLTQPFLESRKNEFEKFLQKLLASSQLRGSELVYNFLRCSSEEFTTGFLSDIRISKMIKTMPAKLTKERGQHLEPFLMSFIASTEQNRVKPNKNDLTTINDQSPSEFSRNYFKNALYNDIMFRGEDENNFTDSLKMNRIHAQFEFIYDYILFFLLRFYNLQKWILNVLYMLRPLIRKSLQSFVQWYLNFKIHSSILEPETIVTLISFLRDSLYFEKDLPPRNSQQKNERSQAALKNAKEFIPDWVVENVLGREKHDQLIFLLFSMFQYPMLNKQLLYISLDVVVKEIFPEILIKDF